MTICAPDDLLVRPEVDLLDLGRSSAALLAPPNSGTSRSRDELVDAAVDDDGHDSFPASDPPSSWWGGLGDPVLLAQTRQ